MTNEEYWQEYEKQTGEKRPPWIDGVGNVNHHYYTGQSRPPTRLPPTPARVTANYMPQVRAQPLAQTLMPQQQQMQAWQPGLRGWQPGRW